MARGCAIASGALVGAILLLAVPAASRAAPDVRHRVGEAVEAEVQRHASRPAMASQSRIRLSVSPRTTRVGRRTRFAFRVTQAQGGRRRAVRGATIRFAGRRARTGRRGRATVTRAFRTPGRYRARASKRGLGSRTVAVRVLRARCSGAAATSRRCRPLGGGGGAAAGDFNGDGFADLAVGVPREDVEGRDDAGAVNVVYGSPTGLDAAASAPVESQFWHQDVEGIEGVAAAGDRFGSALVAGDFNGDGFSDLAVGVPFNDLAPSLPDSGEVNVLYGSIAGLTASGDHRFSYVDFEEPLQAGGRFGASLVAADFGLGGASDLAVGAPFHDVSGGVDGGKVFLLFGSSSRLVATGQRSITQTSLGSFAFGGGEAGDHFGRAMAAANLGKGPEADLVIGVPEEDAGGGGSDIGVAHVVFGSSNGPSLIGSRLLSQPGVGTSEEDDRFGSAFAAGDFAGDGLRDLAVGVPGEDTGGDSNTGAVWVFRGTSEGPDVNANQFLTQDFPGVPGPAEGDDRFGSALAAHNFGRSGHADLAIGSPGEDRDDSPVRVGEESDDAGAVLVLYGSAAGLSATTSNPAQSFDQVDNLPRQASPIEANAVGSSLTAWNFGRSTHADLAIGVPGALSDTGFFGSVRPGGVIALYGATTGLSLSGVQFWHQDVNGVRDEQEDGDRFGEAVY